MIYFEDPENDDDFDDQSEENSIDKDFSILSQLIRNEEALNKLFTLIRLIFVILLIKFMM